MIEILEDLVSFINKTGKDEPDVRWETHEQARHRMAKENAINRTKAVYQMENEPDEFKRRLMSNLINVGVYDFSNIDELK